MTEQTPNGVQTVEKATSPSLDSETPAPSGPSLDTILAKVDPKALETADSLGIPLTDIIQYMRYQEAQIKAIMDAIPNKAELRSAFAGAIEDLQKKQVQAMQTTPALASPGAGPGGLGNIASIAQVAQLFGLGGSSGSEELNKLAMSALTAQIGMSTAITNAVVAKITGKATSDVAEAIMKE